jgi:hypothetical protein
MAPATGLPPAQPTPIPVIFDDDPREFEPNPAGDEVAPVDAPAPPRTADQRLLLLDT